MTLLQELTKGHAETKRKHLFNDMASFLNDTAQMYATLTEDNAEEIAARLVSELTGSIVSDIIKDYEAYKEAQYHMELAEAYGERAEEVEV